MKVMQSRGLGIRTQTSLGAVIQLATPYLLSLRVLVSCRASQAMVLAPSHSLSAPTSRVLPSSALPTLALHLSSFQTTGREKGRRGHAFSFRSMPLDVLPDLSHVAKSPCKGGGEMGPP